MRSLPSLSSALMGSRSNVAIVFGAFYGVWDAVKQSNRKVHFDYSILGLSKTLASGQSIVSAGHCRYKGYFYRPMDQSCFIWHRFTAIT